jgi:hypothetical protein
MVDRVSKLPCGKKTIPIDVIRSRLRKHVEIALASNNEALIRMVDNFLVR